MSKIAFIYPGQGAQAVGMGKDFYEKSPLSRTIFDQASEAVNLDLKKLCFEENDLLDKTEYTQVAMVTACLAMTRAVESMGLHADMTAGLSLGEYCAIAVAGGMCDLDAIRTVRSRGIFMEHAAPEGSGAMSAVLGMDASVIENVLNGREGVSIANYNCPGQIVITGEAAAVAEAGTALKEAGVKIRGTKEVSEIISCEVMGEEEFHTEYLDLVLSVKLVADEEEAIAHINHYGSHHTDCILTENQEIAEKFMQLVDSAGVYQNCSTRFADGFRYGFGAEVGISTGKIHARGPVGLEGLVTYKYKLYGQGQIVADYAQGNSQFHFKEL